ncbi:MAG TPA: WGxxGxxG family protein [Sphingomicrobium sp.]
MRKRMVLSLILATVVIGPAAAAQEAQRGGIRTETMNRLATQNDFDVIWNAIGLLGLLGLLGLKKEHSDDSYHPSSIE